MDIVILGAGRVGFQLARQLVDENRDVAIIEKDPERAKRAADVLDCLVINEEGNRAGALKQAGIQRAQYFVGVTDSDEVNLITCGMVANQFHVPNQIARVLNPDYSGAAASEHSFLGIDYINNPETEVTRAITTAIERGAVSDIMLFEESDLQIRSISIGADSVLNNRSVEEARDVLQASFLFVVVLRGSEYIIPTGEARGETRFRENDKLYLLATEPEFDKIFSRIGKARVSLDRIVITGGGRIGQQVIEHLLGEARRPHTLLGRLFRSVSHIRGRRKITVIESDYQTCKTISERFPEVLVLNSDISDERFEEDEQLSKADLLIATTENQELNIVSAVFAKGLGVKRTVALVNRAGYVHVASSMGIDVAISPVDSMVSAMLRHITKDNVRRVHSISGANIDIVELSVEPDSRVVGKKIREVKLPPDSLIIAVSREGSNIIPDADMSLRMADHLITIARKDSIPKLEEIFTQ